MLSTEHTHSGQVQTLRQTLSLNLDSTTDHSTTGGWFLNLSASYTAK